MTSIGENEMLKPCPFCGDDSAIAGWNERAADKLESLSERRELDDLCAKIEADAVAGLRYIERHYGRLEGVGWDRVFNAHDELFRKATSLTPQEKD
jgi:hypothetical protein